MKKRLLVSVMLFIFVCSGCSSTNFLKKKQTALNFKPGEGGVIFTVECRNKPFKLNMINLTELDQYQDFKKKVPQQIKIKGYGTNRNKEFYLVQLKLSQGKYLLKNINAVVGKFFGAKTVFISTSKVIDVRPGNVAYLGGMVIIVNDIEGNNAFCDIDVQDKSDRDLRAFAEFFPVLHGMEIEKDKLF